MKLAQVTFGNSPLKNTRITTDKRGVVQFTPTSEYINAKEAEARHKRTVKIAGLSGIAGLVALLGVSTVYLQDKPSKEPIKEIKITQPISQPEKQPEQPEQPEQIEQKEQTPQQDTRSNNNQNKASTYDLKSTYPKPWTDYLTKPNFQVNKDELTDYEHSISQLSRISTPKTVKIYDLNGNGQFDDGEFLIINNQNNQEYLVLNQAPEKNINYLENFNLNDDKKIGIRIRQDKTQTSLGFGYYLITRRRPFPTIGKNHNSTEGFLNNLAEKESYYDSARQRRKSQFMGWFQMGEIALNDIGYRIKSKNKKYKKITEQEFKTNRDLQIKLVMDRFKTSARRIANADLDKYIGQTFTIKIPASQMDDKTRERLSKIGEFIVSDETEYFTMELKISPSGMLAGTHLMGDSILKQFLLSNGENAHKFKDGNKVYMFEYMHRFGNHSVPELLEIMQK